MDLQFLPMSVPGSSGRVNGSNSDSEGRGRSYSLGKEDEEICFGQFGLLHLAKDNENRLNLCICLIITMAKIIV